MILEFRHVTAEGSVEREVRCERCEADYQYILTRKTALDTVPLAFLIRQAHETCQQRLARKLKCDVDVVPCPSCGWVQSTMISELRRRFLRPMRSYSVFVGIACVALAVCFLGVGLFLPEATRQASLDWRGAAIASVVAAGLSGLVVGFRAILALARFRGGGFSSGFSAVTDS